MYKYDDYVCQFQTATKSHLSKLRRSWLRNYGGISSTGVDKSVYENYKDKRVTYETAEVENKYLQQQKIFLNKLHLEKHLPDGSFIYWSWRLGFISMQLSISTITKAEKLVKMESIPWKQSWRKTYESDSKNYKNAAFMQGML